MRLVRGGDRIDANCLRRRVERADHADFLTGEFLGRLLIAEQIHGLVDLHLSLLQISEFQHSIIAQIPFIRRPANDAGNAQFAGQEAMIVFDNVFVPHEHVFMDGEWQFASSLVERFTTYHRSLRCVISTSLSRMWEAASTPLCSAAEAEPPADVSLVFDHAHVEPLPSFEDELRELRGG